MCGLRWAVVNVERLVSEEPLCDENVSGGVVCAWVTVDIVNKNDRGIIVYVFSYFRRERTPPRH